MVACLFGCRSNSRIDPGILAEHRQEGARREARLFGRKVSGPRLNQPLHQVRIEMRIKKATDKNERPQAATDQRIENGCGEIVGQLRTVTGQKLDKIRSIRLRNVGEHLGCVGQNIPRRQKPARRVGHKHGLELPGQAVDDCEAPIFSRLEVDAISLLGMANGQELRSCPRQQPARRQRLVLGPVDRERARLVRWREHRIDGRFRGKLHAARGATPAKRDNRATVTAE